MGGEVGGGPFTTDPAKLAALDGQQYVLLRPAAAIADLFWSEQRRLLRAVGGTLPHPAAPHVTLRGFAEPRRLAEVRDLVCGWASMQTAVRVAAEARDVFPKPFQIPIVRLARTASLVHAYAGLTAHLEHSDLVRIDEFPLDEWVFHLSVGYATAMDTMAWEAARSKWLEAPALPSAVETISDLEFVWYDGGEHREIVSFDG